MDRILESAVVSHSKSILLLGPRQVGKSTFIKGLQPDLVLNLADEALYLEYLSRPTALAEALAAKKANTVFVDEIQRIPSLLNTIQSIIDDAPRAPRFYISGSSARKLKRGNANLLPGRVLQMRMGGLSLLELGEFWNTQKALSLGCLPEPFLSDDIHLAQSLLETYSGAYLKEEIQIEAEKLSLEGFSRFLIQASASSGQILDFTKVAAKARVSRASAKRYYEILEDSLIAYRCSAFEEWAGDAQVVKHPKFYFFDPGVWNGLLRNFIPSLDRKGLLFEHLVVAQIQNTAFALNVPIDLHWFRTYSGIEVDLVLKFPRTGKIVPIEIKTGDFVDLDLKNLQWFEEKFSNFETGYLVLPSVSSEKQFGKLRVVNLERMIREIFEVE